MRVSSSKCAGDAANALDDDGFAQCRPRPGWRRWPGEVPAFAELGDGDDEIDLAVGEGLLSSVDDLLASWPLASRPVTTRALRPAFFATLANASHSSMFTQKATAHGVGGFLTVLAIGSKSRGVLFDEGSVLSSSLEDFPFPLFGEGSF
jgi:hypothetical protein